MNLIFNNLGLEIAEFCSSRSIQMICLLENATHILQCLDVRPFLAFKRELSRCQQAWYLQNPGLKFDKYSIIPVAQEALEKAMTPEIIISGFKNTGTFPLDQNAIDESRLLASQAYEDAEEEDDIIPEPEPEVQQSLDASPIVVDDDVLLADTDDTPVSLVNDVVFDEALRASLPTTLLAAADLMPPPPMPPSSSSTQDSDFEMIARASYLCADQERRYGRGHRHTLPSATVTSSSSGNESNETSASAVPGPDLTNSSSQPGPGVSSLSPRQVESESSAFLPLQSLLSPEPVAPVHGCILEERNMIINRQLIGPKGENIEKIDLPDSGDSDMLTITGKEPNANKAVVEITKILDEMIQNVCGGVAVSSGSDVMTVRGPKDDVEKATKLLKEMSEEKQLSGVTMEIRAKPQHHKFLIGKAGIHIQKIKDDSGARIIFPGPTDTDKEAIVITGTQQAVDAAKKVMEAKIKELDNIVEDTMTVDPKYHNHFVARRGEVLRCIGDEFGGVEVSFPRDGVDSDKVMLKGAKKCISAAIDKINDSVKELENLVTIDCEIEQPFHRTMMGAKWSKVQKITTDFDVQIKFPDEAMENGGEEPINHMNGDGRSANPNIIKITGRTENCALAAEALLELVPVTTEVPVPFEFHRFIIGKEGTGVRDTMNKFDVNIRVPTQGAQSEVILISGAPSNMEAAKGGLVEKVTELEKEKEKVQKFLELKDGSTSLEVTDHEEVKSNLPEEVVGAGPGHVGKRPQDVGSTSLEVPEHEEVKSNVPEEVVGAGPGHVGKLPQDVGSTHLAPLSHEAPFQPVFREEVQKFLDLKVEVNPDFNSKIIRHGVISKIRDDFDVQIQLPRKGAENAIIMITGYEKNATEARDAILKIVGQFESMVHEEASSDTQVHSMIEQMNDCNGVSDQRVVAQSPSPAPPPIQDIISGCSQHWAEGSLLGDGVRGPSPDLTGASLPGCGGLPNLTHCSGSQPSVSSGPAKQDTGHQLKTATNLSLEEARILLHKFEVIFLNVAQIQEFEETFSKGIYEVEDIIYQSWLPLKFASVGTTQQALKEILKSRVPNKLPRRKPKKAIDTPRGADFYNLQSDGWKVRHARIEAENEDKKTKTKKTKLDSIARPRPRLKQSRPPVSGVTTPARSSRQLPKSPRQNSKNPSKDASSSRKRSNLTIGDLEKEIAEGHQQMSDLQSKLENPRCGDGPETCVDLPKIRRELDYETQHVQLLEANLQDIQTLSRRARNAGAKLPLSAQTHATPRAKRARLSARGEGEGVGTPALGRGQVTPARTPARTPSSTPARTPAPALQTTPRSRTRVARAPSTPCTPWHDEQLKRREKRKRNDESFDV